MKYDQFMNFLRDIRTPETDFLVEGVIKAYTMLHEVSEDKEEHLIGGRADGMDDDQFDPEQIAMGIKVEREHTNNPEIAKEIAKDHLTEIEDYYNRLAEMENEAEDDLQNDPSRWR